MEQDKLIEVIELHRKWLFGENGGVRANLQGVDLRNSNLQGINLSNANLFKADLFGCNLIDADLSSCDLEGSCLSECILKGANLRYANLKFALVQHSYLRDADMNFTILNNIELHGSRLKEANLNEVEEDFFKILELAKPEIPKLRKAINKGNIDGKLYEGKCSCLVGTIANIRGVNYKDIEGIIPNPLRAAERFFQGIDKYNTPKTNKLSRLAMRWIEEFQIIYVEG